MQTFPRMHWDNREPPETLTSPLSTHPSDFPDCKIEADEKSSAEDQFCFSFLWGFAWSWTFSGNIWCGTRELLTFLTNISLLRHSWAQDLTWKTSGQNEIKNNPAELFLSLHVYGLSWLLLDVEVVTALNAKNPSCVDSGAKCFWCVHVNKILKYEQNHPRVVL